ncbi:hypothetical protein AMTRI_Chr13g84100 [Amborella trichopoda]
MMDDFLDQFLSSSSWSDLSSTTRSSWNGAAGQTNGLLADPVGLYVDGPKNPTTTVVNPSLIIENLGNQRHAHEGTTENPNYGLNKGLFPVQNQPTREAQDLGSAQSEHNKEASDRTFPLQQALESNATSGSLGHQLNASGSVTPTCSSAQYLPGVGGSNGVVGGLIEHGSGGTKGNETVGFQQSIGDSLPINSAAALLRPSYGGVPLAPIMGQGKLEGFGLRNDYMEGDANLLGKGYLGVDKLPLLENIPATSVNEQDEPCNSHLPSFATGPQIISPRTGGLPTHQQLLKSNDPNSRKHGGNQSISQLHPVAATGGGCNGGVRPRVRARRGQATDPHSIAERLRREKIAERMKNLQELVPNSNKTDKASMLDEIIDYVKFLQLQVKVLSMSRLGAAGAVVPLITETEGSSNLLLSTSAGQAPDLSESQDNIAFEQEVMKLMECNMTSAMQYLQNKGLCLMPIALASAISNSGKQSPENKYSMAGIQPLSPGSDNLIVENILERERKELPNGAVIKQQEKQKPLQRI